MRNQYLLLALFLITISGLQAQSTDSLSRRLSYEQAVEMSKANNPALRLASSNLDAATKERGALRSSWYPQLSAAGTYAHMSNYIGVKQSLSEITTPLGELLNNYFPDFTAGSEILGAIGSMSLELPLVERNFATVDANLMWPVFTGGKRIFADRIGKATVESASIDQRIAGATVSAALVDRYFGLRLYLQMVQIRKESLASMVRHYNDARSLWSNGMLNKAELLYAQLSFDEAQREYDASLRNLTVATAALNSTMGGDSTLAWDPVTPMFMLREPPSLSYFQAQANGGSYAVQQIDSKRIMAKQLTNIEKSGYLPNIALFAKQNLYNYQLNKYVMPRTIVGLGFTWTLFDGLARERNIGKARIAYNATGIMRDKVQQDLSVAVKDLYTKMMNAHHELTTLITSRKFAEELVKVRVSSFKEGMATSTEVVDAQLMLTRVKIAFMQAFYQYDVSLMQLCSLCGMPSQFDVYMEQGVDEGEVLKN